MINSKESSTLGCKKINPSPHITYNSHPKSALKEKNQ